MYIYADYINICIQKSEEKHICIQLHTYLIIFATSLVDVLKDMLPKGAPSSSQFSAQVELKSRSLGCSWEGK